MRGVCGLSIRKLQGALTARTIVHTEADLDRLPPNIARHAVVIPHGEYGGLARSGGEADRDAARAAIGVGADVHVTLMFGQLRTDKGLGDLLAALRALPRLHLLIGGQEAGALAENREALADPALAGRVTIREGFLDMAEAAQLFAASDTVALPYQVASQSGVLLLAYGFRRPVIVYPVGGMAEAVIDGETGWICSRPDAASLTDALVSRSPGRSRGVPAARRGGRAACRRALLVERDRGAHREGLRGGDGRWLTSWPGARGSCSGPDAPPGSERLRTVRAALRPRPVPSAPVRFAQRVQRKLGRLEYEQAVAAPLMAARREALGTAAAGPPRFLVRMDEFPHYMAWDQPERYGTSAYVRFHELMREAGVPYLVAVLPRVSAASLDPAGTRWRALEDDERALLARMPSEGVSYGLHGLDHRTRHDSPRRHSELCGLSIAGDRGAARDARSSELEPSGIRPRVFVPPYNRFDARQYPLLAREFDVVCGGPETVGLLGFQRTPVWRGDAVYLPSYHPLYGHAGEVLEGASRLIEAQAALWAPDRPALGLGGRRGLLRATATPRRDRAVRGPLGRLPRRGRRQPPRRLSSSRPPGRAAPSARRRRRSRGCAAAGRGSQGPPHVRTRSRAGRSARPAAANLMREYS